MDMFLLFYIFSVALTGVKGQEVEVTPEIFSYPGQMENLSCTFTNSTGTDILQIAWLYVQKAGTEINIAIFVPGRLPSYPDSPLQGRVSFLPTPPNINSPSIQIRDLRMTDEGNYICRFTIFPEGSRQNTTSLFILEPVGRVILTASSRDLVEFSSVRLSCSVSSGSSVSFFWLNGSSEVTASDRVQLTDGNTNLTIVSVTRYDRGPYKCDAFNAVSNGSSDPLLLSISFGPENTLLTKSPSQENYLEGSNITLSCSAVSNPAALFYWLLNGSLQSDTGPEFRLINVQMSQSGNYSCQAFNNQTMIIQTSQPSFISVLKNITDYAVTASTKQPIEGNSVNLTCDAAGSIFIRKWKKNGADLALTDNMTLHDEGRVLCFQPLNKTDNGTYSCMISNPLSSVEAEYIMIVNYGPENVQITGPSQITLNETLTLTCSADSTPSATYIWKLNETETLSVSAVLKKNITDFSDSGRYICEATNNITRRTVTAAHYLTVTLSSQDLNGGSFVCSSGCIAGSVIAGVVVIAVFVLVFVFCKKKKQKKTPRTDGGMNNAAFSGSQDLNYANLKFSQNKDTSTVQVELDDYSTDYAEVKVNSRPPAESSPPTYDAHIQRMALSAAQAGDDGTNIYAQGPEK